LNDKLDSMLPGGDASERVASGARTWRRRHGRVGRVGSCQHAVLIERPSILFPDLLRSLLVSRSSDQRFSAEGLSIQLFS